MKKLPVGIQTFRKIIEDNCVYVDKTQYIYNLINGASCYFLSRPRRFGKSLLLDTIGEVFNGNKELFEGLFIYESDYDFKKYPVIRLDMGGISNQTSESMKESLLAELRYLAEEEGLVATGASPGDLFKRLIRDLNKKHGERVVVLIDEYDKPILDHINNLEQAEANRQALRELYGILKTMDQFLRFTFITGVSKFTKTSIFSGLNNLIDITMTKDFANICGIEVESLDEFFGEHISDLSKLDEFKLYDDLQGEILTWYDGYSWDGARRVINPFGLLTFFMQKRFGSYWYVSGSPKFLIDLIKKNPDMYTGFGSLVISEHMMDSVEIDRITVAPLLFQTGYLTVKEVLLTSGSHEYLLEIPNLEVREAFNMQIIAGLTENSDALTGAIYRRIRESLKAGDLAGVLDVLKSLFASIPYELQVNKEAYYHSIFYAIMTVLGFNIDAEVSVSRGRIDAVLELDDKVYVLEFKYKDCAFDAEPEAKQKLFAEALEEAAAQIKGRGYADKYKNSGKAVYQAAFAFLGRDDIEMKVVGE